MSRDSQASTATQQRSAPVAAIRQAIQSETGQGTVSVVSMEDKVVLSGTVESRDAKKRIEERAESAAQGWDIDNQIRVAQQMDQDE